MSNILFYQHMDWCGTTDEDGNTITEQDIRRKALENLRNKGESKSKFGF